MVRHRYFRLGYALGAVAVIAASGATLYGVTASDSPGRGPDGGPDAVIGINHDSPAGAGNVQGDEQGGANTGPSSESDVVPGPGSTSNGTTSAWPPVGGVITLVRYAEHPAGRHHSATLGAYSPLGKAGVSPEWGGSWLLAKESQPNAHAVFACMTGDGYFFVSVRTDCEGGGNRSVGTAGYMYDSSWDVAQQRLFSCLFMETGDRMISTSSTCESSRATVVGELGYAVAIAKTMLIRAGDLYDTAETAMGDLRKPYQPNRMWYIQKDGGSDRVPIYSCRYDVPEVNGVPAHVEHMTSIHSDCEGAARVHDRPEGYLFLDKPTDRASVPIYRCFTENNHDHYLSDNTGCDGRTVTEYGLLGYAEPA